MNGKSHFVFAYGSLMWRPDFSFTRVNRAILNGYHRSLCHYSNHYRGTDERPGLVFGLDLGGYCEGLAYEISDADWPKAYAYLHDREMRHHTYEEVWCPVTLTSNSEKISALCYVMNRNHALYAGDLDLKEIVRLVLQGEGIMGRSIDYVLNTHEKMREIGIDDPYVTSIADSVRAAVNRTL
jgi:glutathione-specific gamma-glutamylcyclotransferase